MTVQPLARRRDFGDIGKDPTSWTVGPSPVSLALEIGGVNLRQKEAAQT